MWKEPFYGFFLIMLNKVWTNKVPTAGVSKHNINYQLAINEDFWNGLSDQHKMGLLKHELLHIAYFHLSMYFNFPDKKMANIAMDMEINQYIDRDWLPEGGIMIENYPDLDLETRAGCRYYYEKLKEAKDEKDKNGTSGDGEFDKLCDALDNDNSPVDHSTWEEFENLTEAEKKLIEKQMEHILSEAAEQTTKKRGTVPGNISEFLDKMSYLNPP